MYAISLEYLKGFVNGLACIKRVDSFDNVTSCVLDLAEHLNYNEHDYNVLYQFVKLVRREHYGN